MSLGTNELQFAHLRSANSPLLPTSTTNTVYSTSLFALFLCKFIVDTQQKTNTHTHTHISKRNTQHGRYLCPLTWLLCMCTHVCGDVRLAVAMRSP